MEVATSPSAIVPEVLNETNYERWSIFMKHYLVGQNLWDVVQSEQKPEEVEMRNWITKNALALHAIKISCGAKAFDRIKKIESAKCAWDVLGLLVNLQKAPVVSLNIGELHEVINPYVVDLYETGPHTLETTQCKELLDCLYKGSFWDVKLFLGSNSDAISAPILENGYTALHVAISRVDNQWIAEELITMSSAQDLAKKDNCGNTALSLAASRGMMRIAKCLIGKNKKLLTISDTNGKIPVMLACEAGHEDMTRYLYRETPLEVLEGDNGFYLLQECITKKMFDVAVDLVNLVQGLAFRCPSGSIPIILTLAQTSPPFFRESELGFCGRLIYNFIRAKPVFIKPRNDQQSCARMIQHFYQSCSQKIQHFYPSCAQKMQHFYSSCPQKMQHFYQSCAQKIQHFHQSCAHVLDQQWPELCGVALEITILAIFLLIFCIVLLIVYAKRGLISLASLILGTLASVLTRFLAKHIYNLKLMDVYARELISQICYDELKELDYNQFVQSGAMEATFQAIKNGIPDIAIAIIEANANIIWSSLDPEDSRNVFACAVSHRQEKLVRYLYESGASKDTNIVFNIDEDGNNTLHLAAKLAPDSQLDCISGAALQLQSELRWFKAVEGVIPRFCKEQKNKGGETPFQLFVKEHKNLLKEAEGWMKKTAESSTVVGTLIITIMFAAAFTVPGGNNQDTGIPIFLPRKPVPFMVFMVSDAVSLFSASCAVLMFLGILTSRYAYKDFLKSLPRKLIIGLSSLFISIATMMVAFCAALFIMLQGQLSVVIAITLLAGVPVTLFLLLQSPLLIEIYVSTFSSDIFDRRRMKNLSKRNERHVSYARFRLGDRRLKILPGWLLGTLWEIFCVCE